MSRQKTAMYVGLGVLAVVGYAMYAKRASAAEATPGAAGAAGAGSGIDLQPIALTGGGSMTLPELPASLAPAAQAIAQAGTLWGTLASATGQVPSTGFINFPSGSQAAAGIFAQYGQYREDSAGNLYVQWGGQVYQVGPQDGAGNWPALLVG